MYRIKSLNVPPQIAISGNFVLMTMGNKYAYGLLGVNREFRMVVGQIFPKVEGNILSRVKSKDFVFPSFTQSGQPFFGVALKLIYQHNPLIACKLYQNRNGMRLVHMDAFFFKDLAYYYNENQDMLQGVREKGMGIDVCNTLSFRANPKLLKLDVLDKGKVEVVAYDVRPNIPLGILSSEEKSILVDVSLGIKNEGENEHLTHKWEIDIEAIRNYKPRIQALVDSFFGVENNNMFGYHTEIGLANELGLRCHVQPTATITVQIECREQKLVAHEDEHRPQCTKGTFSKQVFTYTIKKGEFDPNLVAFWRELDISEGKELIRVNKFNGDLEVTYDYLRFGCPLEPYKDDPFVPDLRIASKASHFNSSEAKLYNGSFLLIELFGANGYFFSRTFGDSNCNFSPINVSEYIENWVHRKRMFRIAYGRQTSPSEPDKVSSAESVEEIANMQHGDRLFLPDAVDHPINIINRVTYRDCKKWRNFFLKTENASKSFHDLKDSNEEKLALLRQELPIMKRDGGNKISWAKKSQPIYIFLAVALDPTESLCEYYTIFGVSIPDSAETNSLLVFIVFLLLVLLWIALFLCGYSYRKSHIRELCIELERRRRLEEAAWKVVYRYEKLLQEHENYYFEEELKEFREREAEKQRIRLEEQQKGKINPVKFAGSSAKR